MASSTLDKFVLRSTSTVSLNERFSWMLDLQLARPQAVTSDPALLQQRHLAAARHQKLVLLVEKQQRSVKQRLGKGSIWTRLGRPRGIGGFRGFRPFGFWGFRHRYQWGARISRYRGISFTYRSPVSARVGQRQILVRSGGLVNNTTSYQRGQTGRHRTALHLHSKTRGVGAWRGQGRRDKIITKEELDNQLDEYMSMSKSRLDADLDEYMAMAGDQTSWV